MLCVRGVLGFNALIVHQVAQFRMDVITGLPKKQQPLLTVFALAVMEYAVGVSKFGKNPMILLVHQY